MKAWDPYSTAVLTVGHMAVNNTWLYMRFSCFAVLSGSLKVAPAFPYSNADSVEAATVLLLTTSTMVGCLPIW